MKRSTERDLEASLMRRAITAVSASVSSRGGKKKNKTGLSTSEIVLKALSARKREKTMALTPHDIWKKILRKAEITDALNLGTAMVEVERVLTDDTFWRSKFLYDFPDLVEFVGDQLPRWIIPGGDPEALPEFRDLPWRRYYYVCRWFMRKCAKIVLHLGSRLQDAANYRRGLAFYPLLVRAVLIPGSTFMVSVRLYHRKRDPSPDVVLDEQLATGASVGPPTVMNIWQFCARFIVNDPSAILGPLIDAREFSGDEDYDGTRSAIRRDHARWYHRDVETNTNIIQIAVMITARLDAIVHMGFVDSHLDLANPEGIGPFISWITSSVPLASRNDVETEGVDMDSLWFRYMAHDELGGALAKLERTVVNGNTMFRTFIFNNWRSFDSIKLLMHRGRHLKVITDKKTKKKQYLIGDTVQEQ